MGKLLFLLFVVVPFVEIYLLIQVGQQIGFWATVGMVIATGAVGAWLARREGARVLRQCQRAMEQGQMPAEGVLGGVLVLIGGVLLVAPGILTDIVGLLLLLPPTRALVAALVRRWLARRVARGQVYVGGFTFGDVDRGGGFAQDDADGDEQVLGGRGRIIDVDPVPPKQ